MLSYDLILIHDVSKTQAQDGEELVLKKPRSERPFMYHGNAVSNPVAEYVSLQLAFNLLGDHGS